MAALAAAPSSSSCFPIPASQICLLNRRVMVGGGGGGRRRRRRPSISTFRSSAISAPVIESQIPNCLSETHLHQTVPGLGLSSTGKVRDIYEAGHHVILVSTDRLSAFDRVLAAVPFKGQVLNQTSLWWFEKTKHIVPNACVAAPDPNVTIATRCNVFPVEFVVRGFVTGSTSTSLWTAYNKGVRNYCGNDLPDGLVKNQRLSENILTPTTKAKDHDVPISGNEIVEKGLMTREDFEHVREKALALFGFGQQVALEHGLILVDTKYEFGKAPDGSILLIDEVHTPDSSRYWINESYEAHFKEGLEPENIDKEFLRLWFRSKCDPYKDKVIYMLLLQRIINLFCSGFDVPLFKHFDARMFAISPFWQIANARICVGDTEVESDIEAKILTWGQLS